MKILFIVFSFFYQVSSFNQEAMNEYEILSKFNQDDNGIIILTRENIHYALNNLNILIYNYKENRAHKQFFPEIQKVKQYIDNHIPWKKIYVAKYLINSNTDTSSEHIKMLIHPGKVEQYPGLKNEQHLIKWILKIFPNPNQMKKISSKLIQDFDQLVQFVEKYECSILYTGSIKDDYPEFKLFRQMTEKFMDKNFGHTNKGNLQIILEKYHRQHTQKDYHTGLHGLMIFNKYENQNYTYSGTQEWTAEKLYRFIKYYSIPGFIKIDSNAYNQFKKDKENVLIFVYKYGPQIFQVDQLASLREELSSKIMLGSLEVDADPDFGDFFLKQMDMTYNDLPFLAILENDVKTKLSKKYKKKSIINREEILEFYYLYKSGNYQNHWNSQPIPLQNKTSKVIQLVGQTYFEVEVNNDFHYIVLYYAQHCIHCKTLLEQIEILSKLLRNQKDIKVCKIDVHFNDIENLPYENVPYIILFKKYEKHAILLSQFDKEKSTSFYMTLIAGYLQIDLTELENIGYLKPDL